ncbi:uncharacterized protein LOC135080875 [Ostrinia nubilalis]|uniref:uncharacterized protein LOC135080875 n=1 Tax=Ostrinia nubilalis TaxID=29057 RepID=UPI00308236FE
MSVLCRYVSAVEAASGGVGQKEAPAASKSGETLLQGCQCCAGRFRQGWAEGGTSCIEVSAVQAASGGVGQKEAPAASKSGETLLHAWQRCEVAYRRGRPEVSRWLYRSLAKRCSAVQAASGGVGQEAPAASKSGETLLQACWLQRYGDTSHEARQCGLLYRRRPHRLAAPLGSRDQAAHVETLAAPETPAVARPGSVPEPPAAPATPLQAGGSAAETPAAARPGKAATPAVPETPLQPDGTAAETPAVARPGSVPEPPAAPAMPLQAGGSAAETPAVTRPGSVPEPPAAPETPPQADAHGCGDA